MKLNSKSVKLTDDWEIIVSEAGASYDARFSQADQEAQKCEDPDKTFVFFYKTFYPLLSACVLGDRVPTAQEAYGFSPDVWDDWYLAVWEMNPDIFGPVKDEVYEEVLFRDYSGIALYESRGLPSFIIRLVKLENEAQARTDVPADELSFRNYIYPKIAACTIGDVPPVDEVVTWPRVEIAKWSVVAMKLNPSWFQLIFDEAAKEEEKKEVVKKKSRSRSRSKKN